MAKQKKTSIRPIGANLLVKRLDAEEKTVGGIVIPDSAREKPKEGRIIALGEGPLSDDGARVPFQVKEGDRVLFSSFAGTDVNVEGEEFLIMTEDDVLAVIG